jgi:hypothetical protein
MAGAAMKTLANYLDDILYWLGAILISLGAYFLFPVSALFVAGGFFLHFSYLVGKARAK